jgi:hypothetical protein
MRRLSRKRARQYGTVLGPHKNRASVRFELKLDGAAPGTDCGSDSTPDDVGEIREPRRSFGLRFSIVRVGLEPPGLLRVK